MPLLSYFLKQSLFSGTKGPLTFHLLKILGFPRVHLLYTPFLAQSSHICSLDRISQAAPHITSPIFSPASTCLVSSRSVLVPSAPPRCCLTGRTAGSWRRPLAATRANERCSAPWEISLLGGQPDPPESHLCLSGLLHFPDTQEAGKTTPLKQELEQGQKIQIRTWETHRTVDTLYVKHVLGERRGQKQHLKK